MRGDAQNRLSGPKVAKEWLSKWIRSQRRPKTCFIEVWWTKKSEKFANIRKNCGKKRRKWIFRLPNGKKSLPNRIESRWGPRVCFKSENIQENSTRRRQKFDFQSQNVKLDQISERFSNRSCFGAPETKPIPFGMLGTERITQRATFLPPHPLLLWPRAIISHITSFDPFCCSNCCWLGDGTF